MLRFLLGLILVIVIVFGAVVGSLYFYLSPEEAQPKIASPSSIRTISTGELIGSQGKHGVHRWFGIPYAQPPVDDLRWKAPRPPLSWEGRREAMDYGRQCVQLPVIPGSDDGDGVVGGEDCLTLNIWAPSFGPTIVPTGDKRLPVMFWIHGGGNSIGSGGSELTSIYDGSVLAGQQEVIVVTLNYRMGPLGWFSHDALMEGARSLEDASGNFGTLDLIAGLRWVQTNISTFGGDPSNVTIFGESAGGTNVLSLLASPLAKGLFQKAIVESGVFEIVPMDVAQKIGQDSRGDPVLSSRELVARWLAASGRAWDFNEGLTLQDEMSAKELVIWLQALSPQDIYAIFDSGFAGMIQTPAILGDGFVIPAMTADTVFNDAANYSQVPLIIGSNRDETALFMGFLPEYTEYFAGFPYGIKDVTGYRRDVKYSSDIWRAKGVDGLAESMSKHHPDDVYVYRFDVDDWRNYGIIDLKELLGAAHALELMFVFGYFPEPLKILIPDSVFPEVEILSDAMMSYWAEFAYTGHPGEGRNGEQPAWAPWSSHGGHRFNLLDTESDGGIRMERGFLTVDGVTADFFADRSYETQAELCLGYRSIFWMSNFDQQEYESLGDSGCD